ncbi:helix-turn-helix domain-containing protein [Dactylosporangium darangshiense]|uniref:helix-turn-helix domain-containing protein n=1 Tax=Dactylosporangium darangshiense TaxID=579108 RepID=UPI0031E79CEC
MTTRAAGAARSGSSSSSVSRYGPITLVAKVSSTPPGPVRRSVNHAPALLGRMQKAATLLRTERRSIESIARYVGYESPVAFAKTFKRVTGRPPGAYRRRAEAAAG